MTADQSELSEIIKSSARELGFDLVGIAAATTPLGFHPFLSWIEKGFAADMSWMERRKDAYQHPAGVLPGCRSVIMVAVNYHHHASQDQSADSSFSLSPRIARYAQGHQDYHAVLRCRLRSIVRTIKQFRPDAASRAVVDTAPLLERDFARQAGIGWFGKNTMLISRNIGSWFFLGAVLTSEQLSYDEAHNSQHCGTCTRCLDACPTDAFPEPYVLDAGRCISYLTIERRTEHIPPDLRSGLGSWLFGCDICQEVCPWNRFAPGECIPEFAINQSHQSLSLNDLLQMTESTFEERFTGTPLERTGRDAIIRNAAIVAGNSGRTELLTALQQLLQDDSELIREAAHWAIQEIQKNKNRSQ